MHFPTLITLGHLMNVTLASCFELVFGKNWMTKKTKKDIKGFTQQIQVVFMFDPIRPTNFCFYMNL